MADFEAFFQLHYQPVVRALHLAFPAGDVEDAAQDAFARAYTKWAAVGSMQRPATWVYVVAARRLRRSWRRWRNAPPGAANLPQREDEQAAVIDRVHVERLLDELAPRQRATVVLRYLAGLNVDETARALRCSPGTVKAATHAALRHLRLAEEARDA